MGFFDKLKELDNEDTNRKIEDIEKEPMPEVLPSPANIFLGRELYAIDCRGANLYVHEKAVVIDRTAGGLWNIGDRNFKVIPLKSIVAIQAKLEGEFLTGYIEFETANSPLSIGRGDKAERRSENSVILSGTRERYEQAREALAYVFKHIC